MIQIGTRIFGIMGAKTRWAQRFEILKELSKYTDKKLQNIYMTLPTDKLVQILKYHKKK